MARVAGHTVTGPGVEKICSDGQGAALSAAITFASDAARRNEEATYYVRDAKGDGCGYATVEGGIVYVRGAGR